MSLFGNVWAFARVAASSLAGASKAVLVNLERSTGIDVEKSPEARSFGPLGVYGRPEPPTPSASGNLAAGECEALCARSMDGFEPLVYRDLRITRRMNPAVGEVGITQYGGGYVSLKWDRARSGTLVSISAPHLSGDAVDESHYLSMDPSDAENSVTLAHRLGHMLSLTKDGAAKLMSPDGKKWVEVSDGGVNVVSDTGMAFAGGIIAGSTNLAEDVALAAAYQAAFEAALPIILAGATAANTLAPLSVTPERIAEFTARVLALSVAGKSQTLKASPT